MAPPGRLTSLGYPVANVLVLAVGARLLAGPALRSPAYRLLGLTVVVQLVADTAFGLLNLAGTYATGHPVDARILSYNVLWGAVALHPSMRAMSEPVPDGPARFGRLRLGLLTLASLLAPSVLVFQVVWGHSVDLLVTAGGGVVLFLLVVLRMVGLVRVLENTLAGRRALEAELEHRALHDALTGLANRTLLADRVACALQRAGRSGEPPAVLFVDLDDFKEVNDRFGHAAGDRLLVDVARRLRESVRDRDTVARLGGDEFAVLVEEVTDADEGRRVAERILVALRAPVRLDDGRALPIRASIGVATSAGGESTGELLRHADVAMYAAKAGGKNAYRLFDPSLQAAPSGRAGLHAELERALERDELRVHYQPIVELADGRLVGVEALVRWQHPTRGLVLPGAFVAAAEDSGLIVAVGRRVLAQACAQVRAWQRRDPAGSPLLLSVNVSPRQLDQPGFVAEVEEVLEASGLPPGQLMLEITEGALVHDVDATSARLGALKDLGVRLAVDDFGTGYSSLAYLKRFPVDVLKIDKAFVDEAADGPNGAALAAAVVALARSLGLDTIAEGVERQAQAETMAALGCRVGQGYHFARPLDAEGLGRLLAAQHRPLAASGLPA